MTEWYRVEERHYAAPPDEWGDRQGIGRVEVVVLSYEVEKETPKGVWLRRQYGTTGWTDTEKHFVLRDARKRLACPTVEEAYESFFARKTRQIRILNAQAAKAERALREGKASLARRNRDAAQKISALFDRADAGEAVPLGEWLRPMTGGTGG